MPKVCHGKKHKISYCNSNTYNIGCQRSKVLKDSARKEFEQAKYERDPAVITRLLFVGRDCLNKVKRNAADNAMKLTENVTQPKK